jgi:hypothetical protein
MKGKPEMLRLHKHLGRTHERDSKTGAHDNKAPPIDGAAQSLALPSASVPSVEQLVTVTRADQTSVPGMARKVSAAEQNADAGQVAPHLADEVRAARGNLA